jgi:photosystem II stability/assembly factor-like uncharacterized protein
VYASTFGAFWLGEHDGTRWVRRAQVMPESVANNVGRHPSGRGVLVSVAHGGVFATMDGARTYRRVGVPGVPVHDLTIAEGRHGRPWLVAATRANTYRREVPRDRRIRAEDLEWGMSGFEDHRDGITRNVAAAPSRPRVVYKAVQSGLAGGFDILRSDDGAETWRKIGEGGESATALFIDPRDPDRAIVGFSSIAGNGLLSTNDGGRTWRRSWREAPPSAIVPDPRNPGVLWIADPLGLHRSTDRGATSTTVLEGRLNTVRVSPRDPDRLIAGGEALFVSEDGGETFRRAFYADLPIQIADMLFDPERRGVAYAAAACSDGDGLPREGRGVLRSTDGGRTWSSFSEGLDTRCVQALALDPDGRYLFAGTGAAGVHRIKLKKRAGGD